MPYLNNDFLEHKVELIKEQKTNEIKDLHSPSSKVCSFNHETDLQVRMVVKVCARLLVLHSQARYFQSQVIYRAQYIQVELPETKHSRLHNEVNIQLEDCPLVDVVLSFNFKS